MATLHEYIAEVSWNGGRDGNGTVTNTISNTTIDIAVPPEFQGPGGASNPEELLTSAIASCYSITLGIIASNRKIPVESLTVSAVGIVEQNGPTLTYARITIRPLVIVSSDATDAQIATTIEMAHKADGYCIITNAVRNKVEVVIDPQVSRAE